MRNVLRLLLVLVATLPQVAVADHTDFSFSAYEVIFRTDSFVESTKLFRASNGKMRVACITSFYFSPDDDYKLYVFEWNSSTGRFAAVNTGGTVYDLSYPGGDALGVADMNNDGTPDIIVGHDSGLSIFLATSAEDDYVLQRPIPIGTVHAVLAHDVDLDGKLDLISLFHQYEIKVSYGDGRGGVSRTIVYTGSHEGFNDMKLGNVDDDPELELVVMSGQGFAPNFTIYDIVPSGFVFKSEHYIDYTNFESSSCVAVGDTNNDGLDDIELVNSGYPEVVWEFRQGMGGIFPDNPFSMPMAGYADRVMVYPVDCTDTLPDLIVIHGVWIGVYHQEAFGLFTENLYDIGVGADHYDTDSGFDLGDVDGDGVTDIVITNHNMGLIWNRGTCSGVALDTDGDTVPDSADCFPSDATHSVPDEVTGVRVWKTAPAPTAVAMTWDFAEGNVDIATGVIAELHQDSSFARATCLTSSLLPGGVHVDNRPGSYWYLLRARCDVATGTYGMSFRGPDAEAWLNANSPCP